MKNSLPILEISGPPRERGRAHGEAFREIIEKMIEELFAVVLQQPEDRPPHPVTREFCIQYAKEIIPHLRDYTPDLFEEAEGISEGAGMKLEEVIFLNGFLEIFDYVSPTFQEFRRIRGQGCTSFGVVWEGEAIVGQTYDLESFFQEGAILLRLKGCESPDTLLYTTTGVVGCAGINEEGIAVVINNLIPNDSRPGVLYPFSIRNLLKARNPGAAVDAILGVRRASGTNYVIGDSFGNILALETSATDYTVLEGWKGPMGHANHYVSEPMQKYEARWVGARGNSIFRHARINTLLRQSQGNYDVEALKELLSDHANYPLSLCGHNEPYRKTICGVILYPAQRKAFISLGNPCDNNFVEYEV